MFGWASSCISLVYLDDPRSWRGGGGRSWSWSPVYEILMIPGFPSVYSYDD